MNIVVEKQPKCVAALRVEIPAERVNSQRDQILKGYASKARIAGFRPGKAPSAVVAKRFQKEITDELYGVLINEAYDLAVKQELLHVLDFGVPEDLTTAPNGDLIFVSKLTLAPEVTVPVYKDVSVTVPPAAVPAADIEAQFTALQERTATFVDIQGRAAEMGDFAVIDYTSTVAGQPTAEFLGRPAGDLSGREKFWVRLDEKAFIPGFVVQLVGLNAGDSKEITLTLAEDFPVKELCNVEMVFQTTVGELKSAVLPALDDEFAAKYAPGKTMEDLRNIVTKNMEGDRAQKIRDMKLNQIVIHLTSEAEFELPELLIAQETQTQADALVKQGVEAGMTEAEIAAQQQEIFSAAGEQALVNLRTNFILQEIAGLENINITENELIEQLVRLATERKVAPKKFIKDLDRDGFIQKYRSSLRVAKTIDFLVQHANVTESTETPLDV